MSEFTGEKVPALLPGGGYGPLDITSRPYRNPALQKRQPSPEIVPGQPFTATVFNVAAGATVLVRAGEDRNYLLIQNNSAAGILYLGLGYAPTLGTGLQIVPGGYYEPYVPSTDDIYIFATVAISGLVLICLPILAT